MKKSELRRLIKEELLMESNRAIDFFEDSKHGIAINKLMNGRWNAIKVEKYLDGVGDSDVKWSRIMDKIANDLGLSANKYTTHKEQLKDVIDTMKKLYAEFLKK